MRLVCKIFSYLHTRRTERIWWRSADSSCVENSIRSCGTRLRQRMRTELGIDAVNTPSERAPPMNIARIPAAGECRLFTALVMLPTSFSGTTYTQRRGWRPPTVAQYERFRLADCFFDGEDSDVVIADPQMITFSFYIRIFPQVPTSTQPWLTRSMIADKSQEWRRCSAGRMWARPTPFWQPL